MRKMTILTAFLLFASPAFADCGDDPRLGELPGMLESGSIPEKPFFLTPGTFIRLQPKVREALGDNVVICPKIPVKNGSPVYPPRLPLDFNVIWAAMEEAINLDDWKNVEWLRDHAQAAPLDPAAIFSLLVVPLLSEKSCRRLETLLLIQIGPTQSNAEMETPSGPLFLADIFAALGGKAEKKETIVWHPNDEILGAAEALAEEHGLTGYLFLPYSGYQSERAADAMAKLGIGLEEAMLFSYRLNRAKTK